MRILRMILSMFAIAMLFSCSIVPQKIPPTPGDNAMLEKIRHDIRFNTNTSSGWGWILWYIPILFLVCAWGYKELIAKKHHNDPKPPKEPIEAPKQAEEPPKQ